MVMSEKKPIVTFTRKELDVVTNWHGGIDSMFYAVSSTGSLKRGTHKPYGIRTVAEWENHLAEKLETEADESARYAEQQVKETTGKERAEFAREAKVLRKIAEKARKAQTRLAPQLGRGLGRRAPSKFQKGDCVEMRAPYLKTGTAWARVGIARVTAVDGGVVQVKYRGDRRSRGYGAQVFKKVSCPRR
jgi:hypothetical protein